MAQSELLHHLAANGQARRRWKWWRTGGGRQEATGGGMVRRSTLPRGIWQVPTSSRGCKVGRQDKAGNHQVKDNLQLLPMNYCSHTITARNYKIFANIYDISFSSLLQTKGVYLNLIYSHGEYFQVKRLLVKH